MQRQPTRPAVNQAQRSAGNSRRNRRSQGSQSSKSPFKLVVLALLFLCLVVGGVYAYATQVAPDSTIGVKVNQLLIQSGLSQLAATPNSGQLRSKSDRRSGNKVTQPGTPGSEPGQAGQRPGTATGLVSDTSPDGEELNVNAEELPPISEDFRPKVPKNGTLSLVAEQDQVSVGSTLTVQVLLTVETQPDGVEFMLQYNPEQLADVKVEPSEEFPNYVKNNVYPDHGKLKVMIMRSPGQDLEPKPNMKVGTLTATVQQAGEISLDFVQDQTLVAGAGGQSLLEQTKPLTITAQ
jgi:hypothetical protein